MKLIKTNKLEEAVNKTGTKNKYLKESIADNGINNMDLSDVTENSDVDIEVPFQYADAIKKHKERIKRNSELFKETEKSGEELTKENQRDSHSKVVKSEPLKKMKLSEDLFDDFIAPNSITVSKEDLFIDDFSDLVEGELEDRISDFLSDSYDFLAKSFSYDVDGDTITIKDIEWEVDEDDRRSFSYLSEPLTEDWGESTLKKTLDYEYGGDYKKHGASEEEFARIYDAYEKGMTLDDFIDKITPISSEYAEWLKNDLVDYSLWQDAHYSPDWYLDEDYTKSPLKDNENHEEDGFWVIRRGWGRTLGEELKNTDDYLGMVSDFLQREKDEININHHIVTIYDPEGKELEEITGQEAFYFLTQNNGDPYTDKEALGYEIEGPEIDFYDPDGDGYAISIWVDNSEALTEASTKTPDMDDVDPFDLVYKAFIYSGDQVTPIDPKTGKRGTPRVAGGIFDADWASVTEDDRISIKAPNKELLDKGIEAAKEYEVEYELIPGKEGEPSTLILDPWTVDLEKLYKDYTYTNKFAGGITKDVTGRRGKKSKKESLEEFYIRADLSNFRPWGQAVEILDRIKAEDKLDDLEALLDEMYPDGLDTTYLNDILAYDWEWLYDMLNITERA